MVTKYSDLELAINTLVSEFHRSADDGMTLNTTQLQSLVSKQLPTFAKTLDKEDSLGPVLEQMGVQSGQTISFQNFWTLINKQAIQLFDATHNKNVKCSCLLQ
uniref:Protein S100-A14-like n=1 Tax=Echeneis naucrates TaxID=173247 RepID=A0A665SW08_ECHNA